MNSYEADLTLSRRIAGAVAAAGGRAYYVGGCVRDAILGVECKDIDLEIYGLAPDALRALLAPFGPVQEKGASFGVLGLSHSNLDLAMPRTEARTGERHTDFDVSVDPGLSPERASLRRDFTINAMMQDVLSGEILDFHGGRADLDARVIRHVSDRSFPEDALRVFRGAQFAARLNARIDAGTLALCRSMDVSAISPERVYDELKKALLKSDAPSVFFQQLERMNHLREFFPEIEMMIGVSQNPRFHPEGDVFAHTMCVLDCAAALRARAEWPEAFMISALVHDLGKCVATQTQADGRITAYGHEVQGLEMTERQLRRLTRHEKLIRYALNQEKLHMRPNMLCASRSKKKKTRQLFDESVCPNDLILLSRADASGKLDAPYDEACERFLRERLEDYRARMAVPMVTGADLIAAGLRPGVQFAVLLTRARQLHFSGIDRRQALKQLLSEAEHGQSGAGDADEEMQENMSE